MHKPAQVFQTHFSLAIYLHPKHLITSFAQFLNLQLPKYLAQAADILIKTLYLATMDITKKWTDHRTGLRVA